VVLEAVRPPVTFVIHSSWLDEAASDHHAASRTLQLLDEASALVTH
jgi:quinol monooxygenase YgiN